LVAFGGFTYLDGVDGAVQVVDLDRLPDAVASDGGRICPAGAVDRPAGCCPMVLTCIDGAVYPVSVELPDTDCCYLLWSVEHSRWWRSDDAGYTTSVEDAGHFTGEQARLRVLASYRCGDPGGVDVMVPVLAHETGDHHALTAQAAEAALR
jgi:hypothetical protein